MSKCNEGDGGGSGGEGGEGLARKACLGFPLVEIQKLLRCLLANVTAVCSHWSSGSNPVGKSGFSDDT